MDETKDSAKHSSGENTETHAASIWRRVGAAAVDPLIVYVPILIFLTLPPEYNLAYSIAKAGHAMGFIIQLMLALIIHPIVSVAYQFGFVSVFGATPGKKLFGLKVIRTGSANEKPSLGPVFMRALLVEAGLLLTGPGLFAIAFLRKDQRRLEDLACGTSVVQKAHPGAISRLRFPAYVLAAFTILFAIGFQRMMFFSVYQPIFFPTDWVARIETEASQWRAAVEKLPPEERAFYYYQDEWRFFDSNLDRQAAAKWVKEFQPMADSELEALIADAEAKGEDGPSVNKDGSKTCSAPYVQGKEMNGERFDRYCRCMAAYRRHPPTVAPSGNSTYYKGAMDPVWRRRCICFVGFPSDENSIPCK